jgi:hypothetical protein
MWKNFLIFIISNSDAYDTNLAKCLIAQGGVIEWIYGVYLIGNEYGKNYL